MTDVYLHESVFLAFRRRPKTVRSALVCLPLAIPPALYHLAVEYATPPTTGTPAITGVCEIFLKTNYGAHIAYRASLDDPSSVAALYEYMSQMSIPQNLAVCVGCLIPKADGWSLADCGVSKESTVVLRQMH